MVGESLDTLNVERDSELYKESGGREGGVGAASPRHKEEDGSLFLIFSYGGKQRNCPTLLPSFIMDFIPTTELAELSLEDMNSYPRSLQTVIVTLCHRNPIYIVVDMYLSAVSHQRF